jgi:ABC-2 type transport system ATP-binding protein
MTATATAEQSAPQATEHEDVVVKCLGLTKTFRDFWMRNRVCAVDHIDLTVHRGEVFGLLGPNGSGKSTTVKMILGLLHPTAGRIAVFGHHPQDVKIKQQLGYLPEESYLYPFLNARETLDYYGKLFHQDRRQRRRRTDMLLEMVGLDKVARRPVGEYSKGMQRRIGLAQALINDPQMLILDEPTTGLDPIGTHQIKDLIRQLAERGKTVLLCSHLLADVEDVTDRVSIMFGGKIRKEGSIETLLTRSNTTSIQASDLDEADIEAVEQALTARHKHIDAVEHPRQKLESLFLDIVHEAQQEGAATSGAGSGGAIAEFLVEKESAHMPEDRDPSQVLQSLMHDESDEVEADAAQRDQDQSTAAQAHPARGGEGSAAAGDDETPAEDVLSALTGKDDEPAETSPERASANVTSPAGSTSGREAPRQSDARHEADDQSADAGPVDRSVIDSLVGGDEAGSETGEASDADDRRREQSDEYSNEPTHRSGGGT